MAVDWTISDQSLARFDNNGEMRTSIENMESGSKKIKSEYQFHDIRPRKLIYVSQALPTSPSTPHIKNFIAFFIHEKSSMHCKLLGRL